MPSKMIFLEHLGYTNANLTNLADKDKEGEDVTFVNNAMEEAMARCVHSKKN